jgi:nitronate monooxygenase
VEEAKILMESGVDAVVAQGSEAGAHRGTFSAPFDSAMVPTLQLVQQIAPFAPVIASGGIMDGRDIRRMLDNGASAVQLGTAFLPCPESGASQAYKQALLAAKTDTTVITRVFSGRPARGLRNEFIARLEDREDVILPYPLQNALTRPMRTAAAQLSNAGFLSLWAGQGVARCRMMPAGDLVKQLVAELAS